MKSDTNLLIASPKVGKTTLVVDLIGKWSRGVEDSYLGKKFIGKKSSVAGKKVLWEYPGNPLKGRKVFLTEKEIQDVWAGVTPVENYFPRRDESIQGSS